ncbi:hypothetical protein CU033_0848 [Enterococcus faecium]|nr:hypothetical protein [Enterococcus faecium]
MGHISQTSILLIFDFLITALTVIELCPLTIDSGIQVNRCLILAAVLTKHESFTSFHKNGYIHILHLVFHEVKE